MTIVPVLVEYDERTWIGNPARCVRTLSETEIEALHYSARHYVDVKNDYLR